MISFALAGLVLGCIFAMAAASLTLTYTSTGILNFAYGAEAYFVARSYYWLHVERGLGIAPAALLCILLLSPLMGGLLWVVLFRYLELHSSLVKIVATIGLSVSLPQIATMLYGNAVIATVPGLAPVPVKTFHVVGVALTLDEVIAMASLVVIAGGGALLLRFTDMGLAVRALVDSRALTSLSGTSPTRLSIAVWTITTVVAGLSGILAAPLIGLSADSFTLFMASAFAAVIAARLRFVGRAVALAIAIGLISGVLQRYVPPSSYWAHASVSCVPFAVVVLMLGYYSIRGQAQERESIGGPLDRAIALDRDGGLSESAEVSTSIQSPNAISKKDGVGLWLARGGIRDVGSIGVVLIVGVLILSLSVFWVNALGEGIAFGIAFLAYSLVTGEGGAIWLCEVTFAGIGAIIAAELATTAHWPVLLAIVVGGLAVVPLGILISVLTVRLGNLYVALATLTFAVLIDNLVFPWNTVYNFGAGVTLSAPSFASSTESLTIFTLIVFCVLALLVSNIRRSTMGLALAAARGSEAGARSVGVNIFRIRVFVAGVAAFCAGIGGSMIAIFSLSALGTNYAATIGLVWLAVLVTLGVRSNSAALIAGISFSVIPAIFVTYLPTSLAPLPVALFGLGAILVVRNPDGSVANFAEVAERGLRRITGNTLNRSSNPASTAVRSVNRVSAEDARTGGQV